MYLEKPQCLLIVGKGELWKDGGVSRLLPGDAGAGRQAARAGRAHSDCTRSQCSWPRSERVDLLS